MSRSLASLALLVAAATAQTPPAQTLTAQAPTELARVHAFGGDCLRILIADDHRHALTVGEHGDLCWWDLQRIEVLRYVPPREHYVVAVALHPERSLAAVAWSKGGHGDDAPVSFVDFATGEITQCIPGRLNALRFDQHGRNLAVQHALDDRGTCERLVFAVDSLPVANLDAATWRKHPAMFAHGLQFTTDGHAERDATTTYAQPTAARSRDGAHQAAIAKKNFREGVLRIDGASYEPPCPETWLEHLQVTDAGLVIAADLQGQLHFVTPEGAMQLRAPHLGTALSMVFSPDGRHLAVHGLGAVRIVALDGTEELALPGSQIVVPGEAGAEFRIFARHRSWRFEAASRREVGEAIEWQEPAMPMLGWRPINRSNMFAGIGLQSPCRSGVTTMIDGAPWFVGGGLSRGLHRWREQGWTATKLRGVLSGPLLLQAHGDGAVLVMCNTNPADDTTSSTVTVVDADGRETWHCTTGGHCDWAVPDAAQRRLWLGSGDAVLCLDLLVRSIVSHDLQRAWLTAVLLPDGTMLASDGQGLLVADPDTLAERRRWPNPDGWASIDVLAAAPDGRHVAIANGSEVRILRLP